MADFVRSAFNKKGAEHELLGTSVDVGKFHLTVKKVIAQGKSDLYFYGVANSCITNCLSLFVACFIGLQEVLDSYFLCWTAMAIRTPSRFVGIAV